VYAASVFTHLPEHRQDTWLHELYRVLRPGGILIASTHSPELTWTRPDLSPEARGALQVKGFVFAPGSGSFNDDSAFHSREYLLAHWGRLFRNVDHRPFGLTNYQDLAAWVRP
jgi:ubiquinone/menaquinone biosynthesis C-methylase UbiE